MATKHYAGLDNNYLPTDGSVPVALGSEAVELTVASGRVSQAVSLEGYDKIAFVTEGDTNTSIDFLEILGNESTDATLGIVKDINASSGYALKMTGIQKLVFGTRISYVPDILKKITLKAKKDSGNTGNLYASVVSYANGQYINKLGNISVEDYISVVNTSSLTDSYTTNIGYIKGVGTSFVEPASNPNSPSELPSTTDEIALILESTGASDIYYIDVISLEEVENDITSIPGGENLLGFTLTAAPPTIVVSARGDLITEQIVIHATNKVVSLNGATWSTSDGTLNDVEISLGIISENTKILDCATIEGENVVVTISNSYKGKTYTSDCFINKYYETTATPSYLGAFENAPAETPYGSFVEGDYFLYIGEYDGPNTEPVPPTDKTNPLYLNPTLTETNEFVYGRMYEYTGKDSIGTYLWKETRKSECFASAQKDALEIAKSSGVYLYVAVVVAQLGLFNDLLVANKLNSTNYKEDADGIPTKGFLLDGPGDIIKAYAMEAYNSKIFGTVESTGFKTLTGTTPVTIPIYNVSKNVWSHDEMVGIIPNQDSMINISGTIDGFNFARAVRRNNKRILQKEHGYESEDISAGEEHYFTRLYPDIGWGSSFFVEVSGYYSGFSSFRRYVGGGYVSGNLSSSYYFARTLNLDGSGIRFGMMHKSEALWGKKSSHVNYHKIWTSQLFNGLVLTTTPYNPDYGAYFDYKVIPYEPNAYYPNTITWNIGANNQNTLSNYVSGTEFYNKFYKLPSIADGYVSAGKIKVKRIGKPLTEYTVTRLVKDGNGISFYTNLGIVRVNKFNEGTSSGVYEHLEITQAIKFKTVPDGIEVKSVLPWGTFIQDVENVTIGTNDARFEYGYFKYLDVLTNMLIRGTLNVAGVNTGYGDNEVYKISEETVDFGDVSGTNKTMSISAMDIKEIRTVNTTGCLDKSSSKNYYLYLKLPAGGTYFVVGQSAGSEIAANTTVYGGVLSGGTFVAQLRNHDVVLAFFNVALIIRRIS